MGADKADIHHAVVVDDPDHDSILVADDIEYSASMMIIRLAHYQNSAAEIQKGLGDSVTKS